MAREGTGFSALRIGNDTFLDTASAATGSVMVDGVVSASAINVTGALSTGTQTVTTLTASALAVTGNITPLGFIVNTVDAAGIAQGASAGDANALSNVTTYITVVSAGPGGYILDGNVRTQSVYNVTSCAASLYPPIGGTLNAVSSLSIAASAGVIVNQVSGTLAFTVTGA